MFGYVRVYKPELKMYEYEQYEGVYCALCRRLGKRYGLFARFALNYDMTFLAVFRMALEGKCPGFSKSRCSCNPFKKCSYCGNNNHVDYAADLTAILMYHKLRDNISDEKFLRSLPSRLALPFAAAARRKASAVRPELDNEVARAMRSQTDAENSADVSVDSAAHPFAALLSGIAADTASSDNQRRVLERFGYCLGRWIYLIDALDDMDGDARTGRFNPYLAHADTNEYTDARRDAVYSLNACISECIAAYELLDIPMFNGILRNVIGLGMPEVQKNISGGDF